MSARIKDSIFAGVFSVIVMFTVMPMMTETAYSAEVDDQASGGYAACEVEDDRAN